METQHISVGVLLKFKVPVNLYTSAPSVKDPGCLVLQFVQLDVVRADICITSIPLTPGATARLIFPIDVPE